MIDIDKIRADFPILQCKVHGKELVYMDSAATAQKPEVVIETVNQLHRTMNANIHRGIHYLAEQTTQRYEQARETVRELIDAASVREIVFTSGATASINLVAYSFGERFVAAGDNLIVSEMEHHSNIVPWQLLAQRKGAHIRVLPFNEAGELEIDKLEGMIDDRTRLVAVTQASNVLGSMPDLEAVITLAHKHGVPVLVDGCQGVVHASVSMRQLDADFYAFSGHKLYGPTGIGVLYAKEHWLEEMPPFLGGGDMVATVSFAKTTYADLPLKFEAGTSNFIGAIALGTAIDYVNGFDRSKISEHEHSLMEHTATRLNSEIEGVRIYGTAPGKCPILSFTIEGTHPMDIGMITDKLGVAIRTGTHCAEPIMAHYGVSAMNRISFGMYNNLSDADRAVDAVKRAAMMLR